MHAGRVQPIFSHRWDLSIEEANALQKTLAAQVVTEDRLPAEIRTIAGVDVAYEENCTRAFAAIALFDVVNDEPGRVVCAETESAFPYEPGLLSFHELPALAAAFAKLHDRPDLVICDGQGIAHPRRFGLACHLGVLYDLPAIGCAKTRLIGQAGEVGWKRGSTADLVHDGQVVGAMLRTRDGVKPLYVSAGHCISLPTACAWILRMSSKYRIPEPIRMADHRVNELKRMAGL